MPSALVRASMAVAAFLLLGAVWLEENRPENALPAGVEWALAALMGGAIALRPFPGSAKTRPF